ncbi:hypothetical protein, partial [Thiolapillus sp.]|uniref:hypothetical protein n=8 Tax=Thiolapillus sp. TaxID=2017437 RepID=UPI0025D236EF
GKRHVGESGEEQYCRLMLLQSFPQVVRIGFGDPAPFAVLSERDRRELLCTAGEDIAVAFLQVFVLIPGQALRQACLRPRDRFWDIPVPKIDSAFDNLFVPQPSWSPSTTQQLRKLVAAPYLAPI